MKTLLAFALVILVTAAAPAVSAPPPPVFPGAVGFGTTTKAGREAVDDPAHIYHVTRLDDVADYNDAPDGTLRKGIEASTGPRVIVFDVSGVIELKRDLIIRATTSTADHGYLTIAGQTAPFPGITLKNGGIRIYSHDVLIQHIGIRPGVFVIGDEEDPNAPDDGWELTRIDNRDCIGLEGGANNIVVDHVSCSWTTDETFTSWGSTTASGAISNVTFSNNIYAYPIWYAGHTGTGGHGLGLLVGPGSSNISIVRNVMAFAQGRNPLIRGLTAGAQVINNFVFRPGATRNAVIYVGREFDPDADPDNFETKVSAIGNLAYLMRARQGADAWHGLTNDAHQEGFYVADHATLGLKLYLDRNYTYQPDIVGPAAFQPRTADPADQYSLPYYANYPGDGRMTPVDHRLSSDPYATTGGVSNPIVGSPAYLKWKIVPGAGKFSGQRDFYDTDLMSKINNPDDDSAWLYSQDDLNGGADPWAPVNIQNTRPFVVANPTGDDDQDGYTNLEEALHARAAIVEGRIPTDPAVSKFDTFTDDALDGWTTAFSGAGGSWAVTNNTLVQSLSDVPYSRAMVDGSNWTDQVIEAKVDASAFNGSSFVAVFARFRSLNDTYYLALRDTGALELRGKKDGVLRTFKSLPTGTYYPLDPHVLRLEVVGNTLRGFVDGTLVLSATDDEWSLDSGKAGVGTGQASAAFDNVFASPFSSSYRVPDDFDDGDANGWDMTETGAGSWSTAQVSTGKWVLGQTQTTGNHRSKRGGPRRDQSMQANVRATAPGSNAFIAAYARYQDVNNTYYLLLRNSNPKTLELKKIIGGTSTVTFATLPLPTSFDLSAWHTLRIEATGGNLTTLRGYLDGQLQLVGSDVDSPLVTGWAAIGTYLTSAQFDDLVISQP